MLSNLSHFKVPSMEMRALPRLGLGQIFVTWYSTLKNSYFLNR